MERYLKTFWTTLREYLSSNWQKQGQESQDLKIEMEMEGQQQVWLPQGSGQVVQQMEQLEIQMEQAKARLKREQARAQQIELPLDLPLKLPLKIQLEQAKARVMREQEVAQQMEQLEIQMEQAKVRLKREQQMEQAKPGLIFQQEVARLMREQEVARQKSYIKGWLSKILLEEWRGELEALRYEWLKKGTPSLWIKFLTGFNLLGLLKAHFQIELENRWLFKRKQR